MKRLIPFILLLLSLHAACAEEDPKKEETLGDIREHAKKMAAVCQTRCKNSQDKESCIAECHKKQLKQYHYDYVNTKAKALCTAKKCLVISMSMIAKRVVIVCSAVLEIL